VEVAAHRDRFNCQHCGFNRHCDDSNPAPFPMFAIREIGLESRTCLLPMVTGFSRQMLRLYGHYKHHLLPYAGGLYDQPNLYIEAMDVIEQHEARLKSESPA